MSAWRVSSLGLWCLVLSIIVLTAGRAASAKTELEFWHAQPGANGQRLVELVHRFNASQTQYFVKDLYNRAGGGALQSVIAAYRAKRSPHVALIPDAGTQVMLLSGAIVPVSQLLQDHGTALEGRSFLEPIKACYVKDGLLNAMPMSPTVQILFYNRDAFRRAGLPLRPPSTFDEIEVAATRVMATGAAKCGLATAWPSPLIETLHAWNGQRVADQQDGMAGLSTTLLINGAFGTKLWETLLRWQQAGLYTYGGRSRQAELLFTSGQCAIVTTGAGLIGALETVKFDWGTGQLPRMVGYPPGASYVQGSALWVMKGHGPSEYRGVARFLEFVGRIEQQAWWHRSTGYLPVSQEALRQLRAEGWFAARPGYAPVLSHLEGGEGTASPRCLRIGNMAGVRDAIEAELEAVLAGHKAPKEGVDSAVRRSNDLLREFADLYR